MTKTAAVQVTSTAAVQDGQELMTRPTATPAAVPAEAAPETEDAGARLRRLRMRSWRRGTREMDLILGPFADRALAGMEPAALAAYDALLGENDQDLYLWVTGARPAPAPHAALVGRIAAHAGIAPR